MREFGDVVKDNIRAILGHALFNIALRVGGDSFFADLEDAFKPKGATR